MRFQFKKHTYVGIDLEVGDKVKIDESWNNKAVTGPVRTIENMVLNPGCQSAVLVKVSGYDNLIDSDWLNKV
jgi:hypothetical protein